MKGYVLVTTVHGLDRGSKELLKRIEGVGEVNEVMGYVDAVVEVEVSQLSDFPPIASAIRSVEGVSSITSIVALPR